jgi:hypothetical protein
MRLDRIEVKRTPHLTGGVDIPTGDSHPIQAPHEVQSIESNAPHRGGDFI